MADRYPTYFGRAPVEPVDESEAFTAEQLVQIRARRIEQDIARCGPSGWPERRRFATMSPFARLRRVPAPTPPDDEDVTLVARQTS